MNQNKNDEPKSEPQVRSPDDEHVVTHPSNQKVGSVSFDSYGGDLQSSMYQGLVKRPQVLPLYHLLESRTSDRAEQMHVEDSKGPESARLKNKRNYCALSLATPRRNRT